MGAANFRLWYLATVDDTYRLVYVCAQLASSDRKAQKICSLFLPYTIAIATAT